MIIHSSERLADPSHDAGLVALSCLAATVFAYCRLSLADTIGATKSVASACAVHVANACSTAILPLVMVDSAGVCQIKLLNAINT